MDRAARTDDLWSPPNESVVTTLLVSPPAIDELNLRSDRGPVPSTPNPRSDVGPPKWYL